MRLKQHFGHGKYLQGQPAGLANELVEKRADEWMKAVYPKAASDWIVYGDPIAGCGIVDEVNSPDELLRGFCPRF
jgi:hypothetical protein